MKSTLLVATVLLVSTVIGLPRQKRTTAHESCVSKPKVISAPLEDWIKNESTDLQWFTTIYVGTPPQEFTVLIDTGSDVLLLASENCTGAGPRQRTFSPGKSSSFSWSNTSLVSPEADFSSGADTTPLPVLYEPNYSNWAVDDVTIQGLTAKNFTFMLAYDEAEVIANLPEIDGVLGLSLAAAPQQGSPTSLQYALLQAGLLPSGIFGMYLPSGQVNSGQLTLGGVDETKFEGELTWVGLNRTFVPDPKTQWVVNMQSIFINGEQLDVLGNSSDFSSAVRTPYPQSIIQVLDTGFSPIIAPDAATAGNLYAQLSPKIYQIDPNGAWGCSCEDMEHIVESGAEITFLLGYNDNNEQQLNVTIPSSVFNLGPYPGLNGICQAPINNWSGGVFGPGGIPLWSLGSTLLKNYYTAWDGQDLRVGFAPLKGSGDSGLSFGTYKGSSPRAESHKRRGYRSPAREHQLEPINLGLGGALLLMDW